MFHNFPQIYDKKFNPDITLALILSKPSRIFGFYFDGGNKSKNCKGLSPFFIRSGHLSVTKRQEFDINSALLKPLSEIKNKKLRPYPWFSTHGVVPMG